MDQKAAALSRSPSQSRMIPCKVQETMSENTCGGLRFPACPEVFWRLREHPIYFDTLDFLCGESSGCSVGQDGEAEVAELRGGLSDWAPEHVVSDSSRLFLRESFGLGELDRFFEAVMVMDVDLAVRAQRLGLLSRVQKIFAPLADFRALS